MPVARAFAALSDDTTRQARLAPAWAVRRSADRQTLARSVSGAAAAVLLVGGVLAGWSGQAGREATGGDRAPALDRHPDE